jgi:hypothetical protein
MAADRRPLFATWTSRSSAAAAALVRLPVTVTVSHAGTAPASPTKCTRFGLDREGLRYERHAEPASDQIEQGVRIGHFQRDTAFGVCCGEHIVDQVSGAPVRVEVHELLFAQLGQLDLYPGGVRMLGGAGEDEWLAGERLHHDFVRAPCRAGDERQVQPPRAHVVDQLPGSCLTQPDLQAGVCGAEAREHGRKVHCVQALQGADRQAAAQ